LVQQARMLDLTTRELFAEAIRVAVPGAFELARPISPRRINRAIANYSGTTVGWHR